jgi:hypothetical protein
MPLFGFVIAVAADELLKIRIGLQPVPVGKEFPTEVVGQEEFNAAAHTGDQKCTGFLDLLIR